MKKHVTTAVRRSIRLRDIVRTLIIHAWLLIYLVTLVVVLGPALWCLGWTIDRDRRMARLCTRFFFRHFLHRCCGPKLVMDDFNWEAVGGPCILIANHQSMLDILMMMQLPPDARCWAKNWPFRIPLLGLLMRLCGHLLVDDFNILPNAQQAILDGSSLYVFPEGTRSRTGKVGRFRDGAFLLAMKTGRPIVPVALHGSFDCFPPGQAWIWTRQLRIQPLGILWPNAHDPKDHIRLRREARRMIISALYSVDDTAIALPESIKSAA